MTARQGGRSGQVVAVHRRALLAVYLANLATETLYRMTVSRGYFTPIKNGEVLLFSVVAALYMYLFRRANGLRGTVSSGLSFLVGPSEKGCDKNANSTVSQPPRRSPAHSTAKSIVSLLPKEVQQFIHRWQQGRKHRLCQHQHSCLSSTVQQGLHMAWVGYLIQGGVKCLGALPKLFQGKPQALMRAIRHKDNFMFAAFLGSFATIFRTVNCLLRWVRDKDSSLHGLLAGFLAGWSMMFYKSSSVALYMASKLGEILYFKGIASGYLPYFKCADTIIYTVSTAIVFHGAVFEPHNLRPAYWNFLLRLTNNRFTEMDRRLLDIYGTQASKMFPNFQPRIDERFWRGQLF